jgi:hypothetical protein
VVGDLVGIDIQTRPTASDFNGALGNPRPTLQPPRQELHDGEHLLAARGHGILHLSPLDVLHVDEPRPQRLQRRPRDLSAATAAAHQNGGGAPGGVGGGSGREAAADGDQAAELKAGTERGEEQREHGALAVAEKEDAAGRVVAGGDEDVEDVGPEGLGGGVEAAGSEVDGAGVVVDDDVGGPVEGGGVRAGEDGRDGGEAAEGDAGRLGEV